MVIIFRNRVPNLRRVGVSQLLYALLTGSVVIFIAVIMAKEGTSVLNVAIQAICSRIIRLVWELQ